VATSDREANKGPDRAKALGQALIEGNVPLAYRSTHITGSSPEDVATALMKGSIPAEYQVIAVEYVPPALLLRVSQAQADLPSDKRLGEMALENLKSRITNVSLILDSRRL
jgi:hypothetical protein